jgi:ketosteroid isomerase-like protein
LASHNTDMMRCMLEAVNAWDAEAMIACIQDDYQFEPIMAQLEGHVYVGPEGVRHWISDMRDHWELFECFPEEYYDLGDRVIAFGHWRARGRVSGVEVDGQPATWVAWIRDGLMWRWQTHTDREAGLREAGVTEDELRELPTQVLD